MWGPDAKGRVERRLRALRGTRNRVMLDPAHWDGLSRATELASKPFSRMGKEHAAICPMTYGYRRRDLYATHAEVAR